MFVSEMFDDGGFVNLYGLDLYEDRVLTATKSFLEYVEREYDLDGDNTLFLEQDDLDAIVEMFNLYGLTEGVAWGRSGKNVVRKFRCSSGSRKGRVVKNAAACFKAPNIKKRMKFKMTKARVGKKMSRKRKRTMKFNPTSKRVQALNKATSRRR